MKVHAWRRSLMSNFGVPYGPSKDRSIVEGLQPMSDGAIHLQE